MGGLVGQAEDKTAFVVSGGGGERGDPGDVRGKPGATASHGYDGCGGTRDRGLCLR